MSCSDGSSNCRPGCVAAWRVDFRALRHQFASDLAAADVLPKTAQDLMRHSTISLTLDHYTHTARGKLASAVACLPDLSRGGEEQAQATGTDDAVAGATHEDPSAHSAPYSAPAGTGQGATVHDDALRMPEPDTDALDVTPCKTGTYGAASGTDATGPGWIRTSDQSIMSRLAGGVEPVEPQEVTPSADAHSAPHSAPPPTLPELVQLIAAWPALPEHVRQAVMTLVRAGRLLSRPPC